MDEIAYRTIAGFCQTAFLSDPSCWRNTLRDLIELTDADACALAVHDFHRGSGQLVHAVGIEADYVTSYGERAHENIWLKQESFFRTPEKLVVATQIVPPEHLVASSFYREWLEPQGLLHFVFAILDRDGDVVTYLAFARAAANGDFAPDEVSGLNYLLPHLSRVYRAGSTVARERTLIRAAQTALDHMPLGIVFCNPSKVLAANQFAQALMDTGELQSSDLLGRVKLFTNQEAITFAVERVSGHRPITVMIMPIELTPKPLSELDVSAIAFIGDPERVTTVNFLRLRELYKLSPAEARMLALLAQGHRLDRAADELGIAYETARKHLKHVFDKTGTDRQAELVRMVVTGPAGLP